MTREEERRQYVKERERNIPITSSEANLIIEGAKWADGTIIDRVCKWLESTDIDMEYWSSEDGVCKELLIEDLKKIMEG